MRKKIWLFVLAIFGSGVIVGYYIHGWILEELDPNVQNILGIGASLGVSAGLVVQIIDILRDYFNKKRETRIENNKLIVKDIQSWMEMSSSLMAYLEYREGHIIHSNSRDPEDLPYYEETKIHLKAYNGLSLWEKAKFYSQNLKDKGKNALEQFDKKVADVISDLQLTRSDAPNWDGKIPYCNLTSIREAIFVEVDCRIKGKRYYNQFVVSPEGKYLALSWGERILARGNREILNCLKNRIEDLINDIELQEKIRLYEDVESKMKENNFLVKFNKKVTNEIIKPFKMGISLIGKCRFC